MKKFSIIVALLLVVMLAFCACGKKADAPAADAPAADAPAADAPAADEPADAEPAVSDEDLKIGYNVMTVAAEYFQACIRGAEAYCDYYGYELIVWDGETDPMKQVQGMENLVNAGCQVIDLRAYDPTVMIDSVKDAVSKGVIVNTYPEIEGCDAFMHYDEYDQGYAMGVALADWVKEKKNGEAEVGFITYSENTSMMLRMDGAGDALAELCPGAKIVTAQDAQGTDGGMTMAETMMQAFPNLCAILACSDTTALGAYEAAVGRGHTGETFFVGGVDGNEACINYIKQENSVYGVSVAGAWLNEEASWLILDNVVRKYLGLSSTREILLEICPVTHENAEEYLNKTADYEPFIQPR